MRSLAVVMILGIAPACQAQVEAPRRLTLTWENDLLAGTDRHYTNGIRLELTGRLDPSALPAWLAGDEAAWGLAVGQRIYTPERLDLAERLTHDRPYAGWSYLALSVSRRVAALGWEDRIELSLGAIGPASGAEATQALAHELFGSEAPRGWRHQLRDEPAVALGYQASLALADGEIGAFDWDVRPTLRVAVGNVATFAGLGASARLGFGVPGARGGGSPPALRLFLTAAAEVRLVGHDVFLDGSLLHGGSVQIEKERVVADISLGFVVAVHDRVSLTYAHTFRTTEFVGQASGDQFGSVSLAVSW